MNPADLKAVLTMVPERAISYLRGKGYHIGWDWRETLGAAHARAFTVAKVTRMDILRDIRNGLTNAMADGNPKKQFIQDIAPILQAKGWWGKQIVVDSAGNAQPVQLGSPRRLATIYQTNLQSAYMAGRYAEMKEETDTHPYWRYIAVLDGRTRSSHAALHNKIYRHDDPVWDSIAPPNGFNCRCRFVAVSADAVKRNGWTVNSSAGQITEDIVPIGRDPKTGATYQDTITRVRVPTEGRKFRIFSPDAGFNSGPMASHVMDELLYKRAQEALANDAQVFAAIEQTLLSPVRQAAWESLIERSLKTGFASGQTMSIGVMHPAEIAYAKAQGADVASGIIYVGDRLLASAKAARHTAAGNALSAAEWKALPAKLANPAMVLWDRYGQTMIYVIGPAGGNSQTKTTKTVVRFSKNKMGGQQIDDAATVFIVQNADIQSGLKSGMYTRIR
ncbi:phage head morphogenesis protein [Sapientia aquatica]|uniref:Phage head morphogenesis protein n=1 Tax=Sapientia aquatica TaxID=1549640 RepID=A0A4R5W1Q8_9BURK|nr:phage head morphogenesis protein [Sapientia aquatica]